MSNEPLWKIHGGLNLEMLKCVKPGTILERVYVDGLCKNEFIEFGEVDESDDVRTIIGKSVPGRRSLVSHHLSDMGVVPYNRGDWSKYCYTRIALSQAVTDSEIDIDVDAALDKLLTTIDEMFKRHEKVRNLVEDIKRTRQ